MAPQRKQSANVDIKIRMKEPLRAQIERAAKRKGISMNAEMVDRLERSFAHEEFIGQLQDAYYGPVLSAVLAMLGRAMRETSIHTHFLSKGVSMDGADWINDPYAFDQVAIATNRILESLRPEGDRTPKLAVQPRKLLRDERASADFPDDLTKFWGVLFANGVLHAVEQPGTDELGQWANGIRARLGPAANRLAKSAARSNR